MNLDYSKIIADALKSSAPEEAQKSDLGVVSDYILGEGAEHLRSDKDKPEPTTEETERHEIVRLSNEAIADSVHQKMRDDLLHAIAGGDSEEARNLAIQLVRDCREEDEGPPRILPGESPLICRHVCSCGRRWSHGPIKNCKCPDIVEVSPCFECLRERNSEARIEDMKDVNAGVGTSGLSGEDEIKFRNDKRILCKDMSLSAVAEHLETLMRRMNILRVEALETSRIKKKLEEDELAQLLTPEEKEAWRRKQVGLKKKKTPTDKQKTKRKSAIQKAIDAMIGAGMTRAQALSVLGVEDDKS